MYIFKNTLYTYPYKKKKKKDLLSVPQYDVGSKITVFNDNR